MFWPKLPKLNCPSDSCITCNMEVTLIAQNNHPLFSFPFFLCRILIEADISSPLAPLLDPITFAASEEGGQRRKVTCRVAAKQSGCCWRWAVPPPGARQVWCCPLGATTRALLMSQSKKVQILNQVTVYKADLCQI